MPTQKKSGSLAKDGKSGKPAPTSKSGKPAPKPGSGKPAPTSGSGKPAPKSNLGKQAQKSKTPASGAKSNTSDQKSKSKTPAKKTPPPPKATEKGKAGQTPKTKSSPSAKGHKGKTPTPTSGQTPKKGKAKLSEASEDSEEEKESDSGDNNGGGSSDGAGQEGSDDGQVDVDESDRISVQSSESEKPKKKKRRKGNNFHSLPASFLARQETTMDWKYAGGTNLASFQQEFKSMAYLNEWPDEMAMHKLKGLLTGAAKSHVDELVEDTGGILDVDDVFTSLSAQFVTPSAKAMAEAKVENMKRRENESAVDFGARWMRAWKASGQKNDESAALKFFKSCTAQGLGEGLVYSRHLHKSVNAVAEALEGVEMTDMWRGDGSRKRKKQPKYEDSGNSEEQSDEEKPQRGRRKHSLSQEHDRAPALSIQQLEVMAVAAFEKAALAQKDKTPSSVAQRPQQEMVFTCQLCNRTGHTADSCLETPHCSKCLLNGHIAACCPYQNGECFGCGLMGHLLSNCPNKRGRGNFRGRGRGYDRGRGGGSLPFRGQCYKCQQMGHIARECPGPIASTPTPTLSQSQINLFTESLARAAAARMESTRERDGKDASLAPKSEK